MLYIEIFGPVIKIYLALEKASHLIFNSCPTPISFHICVCCVCTLFGNHCKGDNGWLLGASHLQVWLMSSSIKINRPDVYPNFLMTYHRLLALRIRFIQKKALVLGCERNCYSLFSVPNQMVLCRFNLDVMH